MPEIPQVRTGCRPHAVPHPTATQTRQLTRAAEHARQCRSPGNALCREHHLSRFADDCEAPLNDAYRRIQELVSGTSRAWNLLPWSARTLYAASSKRSSGKRGHRRREPLRQHTVLETRNLIAAPSRNDKPGVAKAPAETNPSREMHAQRPDKN